MKRALALLLLLAACRNQPAPDPAFVRGVQQWRDARLKRLTSDTGWLTLVGLYWLHDGVNDISLPAHPPVQCRFVLEKGKVILQPNASLAVPAAMPLVDDTDPAGPTTVKAGSLSFQAIRRTDVHGDRFGIRARDSAAETRTHFLGLDYFPPNPDYRVEARFEPYQPPKRIPITNVLGMTSDEISPGALVFTLQGRTFRIDPILEQGETDLFIIFKDGTSGKETYAAARYLYAHPADASGKTVVDFNQSYNPPCAFTPFATCPLPPPQNRLPIRIEAGEKKYAGAHS